MISISILTSSPDYSLVAKKMCIKYPIFSIVYAGNDHLDLFKRKNIYLTDVLILDVNYEILSLGKLINKIKDVNPEILVLLVTGGESNIHFEIALGSGIDGIMPSDIIIKDMSKSIQKLIRKKKFIHPDFAENIFNHFTTKDYGIKHPKLKPNTEKILKLLSEGNSYIEMADALGVTVNVIRYYIKDLYRTLGINNRGAAISLYLKGMTA